MRPSRRRLGLIHTARVEAIEPRLLMSISPLGTLESPYGELQQLAVADTDLVSLGQTPASYGLTGAGQTVVVIDSGIAYSHSALGGGYGTGYRVVGGYDFAEDDDNPYDDGPLGGHGTHVAGIVGSSDASHLGLASGVDLVSLRVFDDAGHGEFGWVEEALQWVHTHLASFANPITTVNLSLGSHWNDTTVPEWASLEDEFAQLEADGIFIAVAAGNSFTSYSQPGLSYPAASSHVVPVSSVDADGQLSYYSQRDSRAIGAPGRSITSTVPDYLGNGNGVDDDFATFSGTSMAAPYVAAASVLLRQAYQSIGVTSVNQQMLYTLMRTTADTISDATTGQNYLRLNLERALDTILPADDFGSTASAAYQMGTVRTSQTLAGVIGRLNDHDYFSFTAASSGTVTVTATTTLAWKPQWELVGATGTTSGDGRSYSFQVVAGQSYTFGVAASSGLGQYALKVDLAAAASGEDHAPGGQREFAQQTINGDGQWYSFTAVNSGILTVQALFAHRAGDVDLELFDAQGNWIAGSYGSGNQERIDLAVTAGQTYSVHAYVSGAGTNRDVDLSITNLVRKVGTTVAVLGTDGDDVFTFTAGATDRLSINGVEYTWDSSQVTRVNFQGYRGCDSAIVAGTADREFARLNPGTLDVQGVGHRVQAASVEKVTFRGGGGADTALLGDSAGDDTFEAHPDVATLVGDGFSLRVEGVARVTAEARKGGNDAALLYDSTDNDTLSASAGYTYLSNQSMLLVAKSFESVHAFSTAGGRDRAILYDSAGNDSFCGDPRLAQFRTGSYLNEASQFAAVTVYATAGGYDTATLADSAGDDVFTGRPTVARLSGAGYLFCLQGFDSVAAQASTGHDRANLYDSAGDDLYVSTPDGGTLSGSGYSLRAGGFDEVQACAVLGGRDKAVLFGSAGNDTVACSPDSTRVSGVDFSTRAYYFEEVETHAGGGDDILYLSDSAGDDLLRVTGAQVQLSNERYAVWIDQIERVSAKKAAGGIDTAEVGVLDCVLQLVGQWRRGALS